MARLHLARLASVAAAGLAMVALGACASVLGLDLEYRGGEDEDDAGPGRGADGGPPVTFDAGVPETGGPEPDPDGASPIDAGHPGGATVVTQATAPKAIAVDDTRLYWIDQDVTSGGSIRSIAKDGTGPVTTIATGQISPNDIAVDSTHLYWSVSEAPGATDGGASCLARMVSKTAGAAPACIATGPQATLRMAISAANVIYLVSSSPDPLIGYSDKVAGSTFQSSKTQGSAVALAGTSTEIFVSNSNGNHIDTALLPGPTMGKILCTSCGGAEILDMVVDTNAENLLWITQTGGVFIEALAGTAQSVGTLLGNLPNPPRRMARDGAYAYVTSETDGVYAVSLRGADAGGTVIKLASGQNAPFGIAVDATRVYWSSGDGAIRAMAVPAE